MGPVWISMARYDTPPHAVHVRGELVDWAVQTITASDSLTAPPPPLPKSTTSPPAHEEKFLSNFWKNRRGWSSCMIERNKTISLVNAVLSAFKHPAQDVDITAEANIRLVSERRALTADLCAESILLGFYTGNKQGLICFKMPNSVCLILWLIHKCSVKQK